MSNQRTMGRRMVAVLMPLVTTVAQAQTTPGTEFTYQGRLKDRGTPASGAYDLRFTLWDDPEAIGPIGSPVCRDNVPVVEGLFTVQLDFGDGLFDGNARWIEISVRPGGAAGNCGTGAYTVLGSRQPVTPAPFALYALDAPGAGLWQAEEGAIYNTNAGNVGVGTAAPTAKLDVRGDVKLGASGELFAPGGEENLRIVRGRIGPDGGVATGIGFTASYLTASVAYLLNFDPPFADQATVTANANGGTSNLSLIVNPNVTGTQAVVQCRNASNQAVPCSFVFIAVGPR